MRRTKLLSVLGGLAGLAFATSCDSFLDPSPSDVLAPENFYKTSSDAVAAVNGVYEQVKWSYWLGFWYMSDIATDRKSTRLNSSHLVISYAVFCLKKKKEL